MPEHAFDIEYLVPASNPFALERQMNATSLHRCLAIMLVGPIVATNLALAALRLGFLDAHAVGLIAFIGSGVGAAAVIGVVRLARQKSSFDRSKPFALKQDALGSNSLPLDRL